jgi:hypothetical protein
MCAWTDVFDHDDVELGDPPVQLRLCFLQQKGTRETSFFDSRIQVDKQRFRVSCVKHLRRVLVVFSLGEEESEEERKGKGGRQRQRGMEGKG